ncbi:MIP/aquaporin family protein [Kocuria marina]|uniref:Aquaporin Z n=1 Tax=Kocuria marina subsp. indica TaxID=1049583 RepID=A0A1X7D9T0_9MICC|nr:aquaporin [Kocuria indica]OXS82823.1 hypothetical protein B1B07_07575 [Kocuria indica]RLP57707.1 hypothetical protein D9R06_08565 [Kocuria indica]SMF11405.1 aquaporin Z [Kocuria indica]
MSEAQGSPSRPQRWANYVHPREWLYEFIGTFGQLGLAYALVASLESPLSPLNQAIPNPTVRLILIGAGIGALAAVVAISPLGRRSGAHLNPSVTVGFWARGRMSAADTVGYIGAQILGACVGAALFALALGQWAETAGYARTAPRPGINLGWALLIEIGLTFVLVLTVLLMVSSHRTKRWTPAAATLALAVLVPMGGPPTGASMNFARTLGPDLVAGDFTALWVYAVGPLIGAVLAALVHRSLGASWDVVTTRIYHAEHHLMSGKRQGQSRP